VLQLLNDRDDGHFLDLGVPCTRTFEPRLIPLSISTRVESSWVVEHLHGCVGGPVKVKKMGEEMELFWGCVGLHRVCPSA
jgi:hypothetical protein